MASAAISRSEHCARMRAAKAERARFLSSKRVRDTLEHVVDQVGSFASRSRICLRKVRVASGRASRGMGFQELVVTKGKHNRRTRVFTWRQMLDVAYNPIGASVTALARISDCSARTVRRVIECVAHSTIAAQNKVMEAVAADIRMNAVGSSPPLLWATSSFMWDETSENVRLGSVQAAATPSTSSSSWQCFVLRCQFGWCMVTEAGQRVFVR